MYEPTCPECGNWQGHAGDCFGRPDYRRRIRVENKRTYRGPGTYIGRPSKYGNPYIIKGQENNMAIRLEAILAYEIHAREMLAADGGWLNDLMGAEVLVCWCAPLPCHGDVLVRMIEELDNSQPDR